MDIEVSFLMIDKLPLICHQSDCTIILTLIVKIIYVRQCSLLEIPFKLPKLLIGGNVCNMNAAISQVGMYKIQWF